MGWVDPWGLFLDTSQTSGATEVKIEGTQKIGPKIDSKSGFSLWDIPKFAGKIIGGIFSPSVLEAPTVEDLPQVVTVEAKTATATDAVIGEEEEQKCKEICFDISTANPKGFTYPDDMEDIYGNIVPKPQSGKKPVRNAFSPARVGYKGAFAESIGKTKKEVSVDKDNYDGASSIHHIRPVWAGGEERTSTNLALMEDDDHQTMHEWWNTELEELAPDINKKIENCAKENGKSGGALNTCKIDELFQNPEGKAQNIDKGESGITHLSTCLAMQGVTLNVSVDEPCSQ